ncbi:hypothetical protein K2173_008539 [Erythroxylum novogranatense]|uniref:Molybdenum cofactor sulfurase n=1 Tax=Erythroxylum novogranatense TaxID=1862640 RepID=A0AAV8SLE3_9ROSI|nr:hypothetical protein K2173_008539 [Erythroxylum novogranatense]
MQSPCLKQGPPVCFHDCCCPGDVFGFRKPLNNTDKTRTSNTSATCRRNFAAVTAASIFPNKQFTNPECLPSLEESFLEFNEAYPEYSETYQVDDIRAQEYHHLSRANHTCLDYIGVGLFSYSQLQRSDPKNQLLHSYSSPSLPQSIPSPETRHMPLFMVSYKTGNLKSQLLYGGQESALELAMKRRIMSFLNISEKDYTMVFTANRKSAFKLVAESYPFKSNKKLLTVYDYEGVAVEAMINSSEKKGAEVLSAEFSWPRLRVSSGKMKKMLVGNSKNKKKRGLFVFPLHSRVTGAVYPYWWMNIAQENGWHIMIDACALGPKDMDSFGLSLIRPDFLVCTFYKIFGENPSGFGCLFVKKTTVPQLEDYSSIGVVSLLPARIMFHSIDEPSGTDTELKQISKMAAEEDESATSNSFSGPISSQVMHYGELDNGETSAFETAGATEMQTASETKETTQSGKTANMMQIQNAKNGKVGILEIECKGLDQVDSLGLTQINKRGRCLINWLVNALMKLKHPNTEKTPLVRIYGPKVKFDRGPALAFNVFDWKGENVEAPLVQKLAERRNISVSYGTLHHISFLDKHEEEKRRVLEKRSSETKGSATKKGKEKPNQGMTVVTVAFGFLSNFEDAYRLWSYIAQFLDADFVEKERWRYTALNQNNVEV